MTVTERIGVEEFISVDLLTVFGGVHKNYTKDEYIFHEDEHSHFYYQIISGKVKMVSEAEDGKEFIQGFFGPGQSFGEPPIFDEGVYPASAKAEEDSVIIRLAVDSFIHMLKQHFDIHWKITKLLAHRIKHKAVTLKEISCHTPEHRILNLLDNYKKELKNKSPFIPKVKVDFTRQEIADMCGLRVETVIRVIRQMHEKDMLVIKRGKVYY